VGKVTIMSSKWAWSSILSLLVIAETQSTTCPTEFTVEHDGFTYTKDHPIVWIGGYPRSGTTLMRVLMEMGGNIRCGPETHIIPRMLARWEQGRNTARMNDSGVNPDLYDEVASEFLLKVIAKHDHGAKQLCNKDPFTLRYMTALTRPTWFPQSKMILMIRDPRAIASSLQKRKISIGSVDNKDLNSIFASWSKNLKMMLDGCIKLNREHVNHKTGSSCLMVSYESLVLDPKTQMTRVMKFLGYNFDSAMLNHSSQINNITLAPNEPSTSQVSKPIYKSAIYDWVDRLAHDKSAKTRRALEKLETMPTWARIKRYFPRYDRKPSVEKQKLEAQLKKENDKSSQDSST